MDGPITLLPSPHGQVAVPRLYDKIAVLAVLRKVRTFWSLGRQSRAMVIESLLFPFFISAGFRLAGVARTQGLLRRWASFREKTVPNQSADDVVLMATRAQRIVKRSAGIEGTCLVRSFALWAMLLRRGIPSDLRFGVRKRDGKMEGHAWLERGGVSLNEEDEILATYTPYHSPVSFDLRQK